MRHRDGDGPLGILFNSHYDKLNDVVEFVNIRHVRISRKEKKIANENFKKVMDVFISTMKEVDSSFKDNYREIKYTGSFFDNLKISKPNEYDLNIILKPNLTMVPARKKMRSPSGHVVIEVLKDVNCESKPYSEWLYHHEPSDRYFLKIDNVRYWLQGVVTKAKNKIEDEKLIEGFEEAPKVCVCSVCSLLNKLREMGFPEVVQMSMLLLWKLLKISESGPACTLEFKDKKRVVSIDLVPCLEFGSEDWPVQRKLKKGSKANINEHWYAVPKGPRRSPDLSEHKFGFLAWRLSFPDQEKCIINNLNYFKYTLRMLKHVRDQLKIFEVASYYIKTLFLWEIERIGKSVWRTMSRGRLFMYMLVRFKEALEEGEIAFYWDPECNLIGHVSEEYLENKANRVTKFINMLK